MSVQLLFSLASGRVKLASSTARELKSRLCLGTTPMQAETEIQFRIFVSFLNQV